MNAHDLIRAWKDPQFRASLQDAPAHPAGMRLVEIDEGQLQNVAGGALPTDDAAVRPCGWICSVSGECWGFDCTPTLW